MPPSGRMKGIWLLGGRQITKAQKICPTIENSATDWENIARIRMLQILQTWGLTKIYKDGSGIFLRILIFLSSSTLTSLKATLVQNYDQPTNWPSDRLTWVKCRSTSVAKLSNLSKLYLFWFFNKKYIFLQYNITSAKKRFKWEQKA